jgi:hypothetical protein
MLLVDGLVTSPFKGLLWVFKEIHEAVQKERTGEAENVTRTLSELYMKLEAGAITDAEFSAQEQELLDRLDAIDQEAGDEDAEPDESESDESDEYDEEIEA